MITDSQKQWGLLFVLVGPPGVGKNAMMNAVLERVRDLRQLPTATTRPMRATEQQGREHLFVTAQEFQSMIDKDELIEWQTVHGKLYGTPRATLEKAFASEADLIADIEVLGAADLHSAYPDNTVLVFIQPPSLEELRSRMQTRGEPQAEIEKRMQRVEMEMRYAPQCDYLITNHEVEVASEALYAIVLAERSRRELRKLRHISLTPEGAPEKS